MRSPRPRLLALSALISFLPAALALAVDFPGPQPGPAQIQVEGSKITLKNNVILATWEFREQGSGLVQFNDKLTGESAAPAGMELFRLGTATPEPEAKSTEACCNLRIMLNDEEATVQAANGMGDPRTILTIPRGKLPGKPSLMRLGKLNLQAEPKDHGDPGQPGQCSVSKVFFSQKNAGKTSTTYPTLGVGTAPGATQEWTFRKSPRPGTEITIANDRIIFNAGANTSAAVDSKLPEGTSAVGCQIFKGSDQGMSWGPALAIVMEGGEFLLVGLRDEHTLNITTKDGERMVGLPKGQNSYPKFDLSSARDFRLATPPQVKELVADPKGQRLADRIAGKAIEAEFVNEATGLNILWRAELRDDSNYIRTGITLRSPKGPQPLTAVELMNMNLGNGARVVGLCPGSPAASDHAFSGVEMPGSETRIQDGSQTLQAVQCQLTVSPQQDYTFNAVFGVYPKGQLRRAFLYYIERERARPSAPFLHYNCWYDLGFSVSEGSMLDVVAKFNAELVQKRGVPVKSYLVDDGWDNPGKGLWIEDARKFPQGFPGLKEKMAKTGSNLGIWISPLGGYGGAPERTAHARKMGLIPENSPLDFAQPAYKAWFQNRCLELMRDSGVNYFKWDKAGDGVGPHFMALLDVARHLRQQNPEVFVNVTVGTWPSPFWLTHIDTTWRNGSGDVAWAGVGDDREKWLTFRDGYCRALFVEKAPLYPLNSVMHHGIVHGRCFQGDKVGKSGAHLKNEARSYFGTGAMLQELYITPSMMTPEAWDQVAEAAKWGAAHAETLVDSHWVGGNPLKLEVYGYASWSRKEAILTLRNPSDKTSEIELDAAKVFELPEGAPQQYRLQAAYADQRYQTLPLEAGKPVKFRLEPFEVLVFTATPAAP